MNRPARSRPTSPWQAAWRYCRDLLATPPVSATPPPPPGPADPALRATQLEQAARQALRNDQPENALRLADQALALDPENLLAHHHRGRAMLCLGMPDDARAAFEAARPFDTLGVVDEWLATAGLTAGDASD